MMPLRDGIPFRPQSSSHAIWASRTLPDQSMIWWKRWAISSGSVFTGMIPV